MKAENFGKNLKRLLKALNMTQADLAKRSCLTPAAISQIISGEREPTLSTICKILTIIPVQFEILTSEIK